MPATELAPDLLTEGRRQVEICNACRYCEGLCSVFPSIARSRTFAEGDLTHLANLCHNCRGCYYSCQYKPPHDFQLNLPKILAELRQESWEQFAVPGGLARIFHRHGLAVVMASIAAFAFIFLFASATSSSADGEGFYAIMSHGVMVALFLPSFLIPLVCLAVSLRRYWHHVDGQPIRLQHVHHALRSAASLKNLDGGQGHGCNYQEEDRYSNARRWNHQLVMYGFLLCFAATSTATVMHYGLNWPAPYPLFSLPKLFGLSGGAMMAIGCLGLIWLKTRGDRNLSDPRVFGGELAFLFLLFFVAISGLLLYILGDTRFLTILLVLHLSSVLTLFLLTPFSKMSHGFFRLAALLREAQFAAT